MKTSEKKTRERCPRFEIQCSEEEKVALKEKAKMAGYGANFSEYVKRCALSKRIDHRADVEHIVALNRLGCRLKDIHATIMARPDNPIPETELRIVLDEIVTVLRRF